MADRRFKLAAQKAKRADELLGELIHVLSDLDNPLLIIGQLKRLRRNISKSNASVAVLKYRSRCEIPFPSVAPELYKRRANKKEKGAAFVARVYGTWLESGFPMPLLKSLDMSAYLAFRKNDGVNRVHLLTEAEWNSLALKDALAPGGLLTRPALGSQEQREKGRLKEMSRSRQRRAR